MYRILALLLLLTSTADREAAEPCCVDDLFAEAFLYGQHFSREWPDDFPIAPLRESSLEMIGSQLSLQTNRATAIAWRSDDDLASSFAALKSALAAQDWHEVPTPGMTAPMQGGFILDRTVRAPTFEMPRRFCKGAQLVHTMQRASAKGTILTLTATGSGSMNCNALINQAQAQAGQMSAMNSFMRAAAALPVLRLPAAIDTMMQSDSSGGTSAAVRAVVVPAQNTNPGEVIRRFDTQMNEQGWFNETAFGAGDFVSSVWRKTGEDGSFVAWLMAYGRGEDLLVRMTVLDPETQGGASQMSAVRVLR